MLLLCIASEHNGISLWRVNNSERKIPRQLLSHMHIRREEEKALLIKYEVTVAWRKEHNIPDTESLLELIQAEEM